MKYFILFLSFSVLGNFIDQENLTKCHNKEPYKIYKKEKPNSYDVTGKLCETHVVVDVEVDDPSKPIYASPNNVTDCFVYDNYEAQIDDCRFLIRVENIGTQEDPVYQYPLCTDTEMYALYAKKKDFPVQYPGYEGEEYFSYCTKLTGYEQMTTQILQEDPALLEAYNNNTAKQDMIKKLFILADKQTKIIALNEVKSKEDLTKKEKDEIDVQIEILEQITGE